MLQTLYKLIGSFLPASFRSEFSEEITADLADLMKEYREMNTYRRISLLRREISGWLVTIVEEQSSQLRRWGKEFIERCLIVFRIETEVNMPGKSDSVPKKVIQDGRTAILTSLPPFLFGSAISITWLIIGGVWYSAPEGRLKIALAAGLLVAAVIAAGGLAALVKRFPIWGYTWLGADMIGFALMIQSLTEEHPYLIPEWLIILIIAVLFIFCAVILTSALLKSWQAAVLISIGMSTTMALANVHLMAIGPFHRVDLAFLGSAAGLLLSLLTYAFARTGTKTQILIICGIGAINVGLIGLANSVWSVKMVEMGKSSPFIPMIVIMLILLAAGPFAGIFQKQVRTLFSRFVK